MTRDPFLDEPSIAVNDEPCLLFWLPMLALWVTIGVGAAGAVLAYDAYRKAHR